MNVQEFDINIINPTTENYNKSGESNGSKIAVIGKPGSGKSTLLTAILYSKKHIFPAALVMSESEDSNNYYSKIVHPLFVHNKYSEKTLENFIERQKIAKKYLPNPWCVLLLDDCVNSKKMFNTNVQQSLFKKGRHYSMLYILSLQYALDVPPDIRTSIDYTFILREPNLKNRKKLYENFAGIIPEFKTFCLLMDELTEDYMALVIKNMSTSNCMEDNVFYYKAPIYPEGCFTIGCNDFKDFASERYDPNLGN